MANEETTTKFKVDISELKKAMQDAKRQISIANSEFKASSSAMEDWENSADGISEKLKQLDSVLASQNKILDSLEQQYAQVAEEQGEFSAAAERLKIAINNQKAAINKTEKDIKAYGDRLDEVKEAEQEAARTGKTVAEVLNDVGNEAEDAADGFTIMKGGLSVLVGNLMTSFVNALKEGAQALMGLSAETREYRAEMAKLETAFTTAGFTTQAATDVYKDFYAVIGEEDRSVEAVNHLAQMVDTEKDLETWTNICTGVWATFGDSLPIEGLTEAANETVKTGQVTGVLADALNWAGISEDDFNEKLAKCTTEQERQKLIMDTLNGTYSEASAAYQETNKSVMDANRAQSDYTDTIAALGAKIEPIMTALKVGVTGLLNAFLEMFEGVDIEAFVGKIQNAFSVLVDTILPAIVDGFKGMVEWIDRLSPLIVGLGVALGGLALVGLAQNFMSIVAALKAWALTTPLVTAAQWLLNAAMAANPITLIIIAITALVAAFVVLWKKSEGFRNFWIGLWEKIQSVAGTAKDWILGKVEEITNFFTETVPNALGAVKDWISSNWQSLLLMLINPFAGLFKYFYDNNEKFREFVDTAVKFISQLPGKVWTWLVNTINKVTTWIGNMVDKAREAGQNFVNKVIEFYSQLPGKVWTWLVDTVNKVASWATDLANKGREAAQSLVDTVVTKISELPGKIISVGHDLVEGLWNGINDKYEWIKNKITSWVGNVMDFLKNLFGINSPSKLMADEIGRWLPEGMAVGVEKNAGSVLSSMKSLATDTLGTVRQSLGASPLSGGMAGGVVNNYYQTINSPKQLSRFEIYRQSKNLLGLAGGR